MSLPSGTHLGNYEILSLLGTGGMGEVYRARDTRLGRDVALKTLPESLTDDAERVARFRREATLLAALNHPHVASIYGFEEIHGHRFLALELVEGETLAARIEKGPLPIEEALTIAREIAEALAAAHDRGIIHRDLKPSNIALTHESRVKVLDFGLAKASDALSDPDSAALLNSPTVTSPALTRLGVILGTAAYMSPEQARGRVADKRTDVWAFGCVLFEMLSGRRPFDGDDVSETVAAVLKSPPPWEALPAAVPAPIRSLVEGCLEKNHRERVSDMSTPLFILKNGGMAVDRSSRHRRSTSGLLAALALVAFVAGVAVVIALWQRPGGATPPVVRLEFTTPQGVPLTLSRRAVAISPDGTRIVYSADGRLYLRALSSSDSIPIAGAESAIYPVFSPDGESIVFWTDPTLKRISVHGGVPVTICETTPAPFGLDWSASGIVYLEPGKGIKRVSPDGGTPEMLLTINARDEIAQGPQLLSDDDTLLFTLAKTDVRSSAVWDYGQVVAHSLKTGARKVLVEGASDGRYLATGHLVYMTEGTLMAVPFDARNLQIKGGPVPVVEGIRRSASAVGGGTQYAYSNTGTLVYVRGPARTGQDDVFLYDRDGQVTPLKIPHGAYSHPRVSPDGKWLAVETTDRKQTAISLYELSGASAVRRLTFEGNNRLPIWSADSKRVAFQSDRDGDAAIFWQSVNGGAAERLTRPERGTSHSPESWSPRGDLFLFSVAKGSEISLWTFSIRDRKPSPFGSVISRGTPTNAAFSPDGRWIAYQSGESGSGEAILFVQPFPPTGDKFEIARGGRAMWSPDGKELFFVPAPGQFRAVSVRTTPTFAVTGAANLPRRFGLAPPANPRPYDVLPDGRFVAVDVANEISAARAPQIQVVLNWFEDLKTKAPIPR
jgi:serine/threonine-protein kinase